MYDPCWHPTVRRLAARLAMPTQRRKLEVEARLYTDDFRTRQLAQAKLDRVLAALRAIERDPIVLAGMGNPLHPDIFLINLRALLVVVDPTVRGWMEVYEPKLADLAERTKPMRQALLAAEASPPCGLC
jgi:hypothetical protein